MRSKRNSQTLVPEVNFHQAWVLIIPMLAVGCALPPAAAVRAPNPREPIIVTAVSPTKLVETRYDLRGYREASNPAVRHESHAVYRSTRVSITAGEEHASVPRESYPPASYAPLPASEELAAELATQKSITADIRAIQTSMVETQRQVQSQYATLVRESAEASKVREQLEAERARVRAAVPVGTSAAPVTSPAAVTGEVKW